MKKPIRKRGGIQLMPEYKVWVGMKQRILNPRSPSYHYYGGRGLTMCPTWKNFQSFLNDVGSRPSQKHTLDRIDNDLGYHPGNVRWATRIEQNNNRKNSVFYSIGGKLMTVRQISNHTGVPIGTIQGWTHAETVDSFEFELRRRLEKYNQRILKTNEKNRKKSAA